MPKLYRFVTSYWTNLLCSRLKKLNNSRLRYTLHRHHIKHSRAKFQMLDECFLGQFHQPKRVSATDLGKTQEIPKDLNTKLHNR